MGCPIKISVLTILNGVESLYWYVKTWSHGCFVGNQNWTILATFHDVEIFLCVNKKLMSANALMARGHGTCCFKLQIEKRPRSMETVFFTYFAYALFTNCVRKSTK